MSQHDKFEVAEKLTAAAFALDSNKHKWPDVDQGKCLRFAEQIYGMASKCNGGPGWAML